MKTNETDQHLIGTNLDQKFANTKIQNILYKLHNYFLLNNYLQDNLRHIPMLQTHNSFHFVATNALDNFPISSN